LRYLWTNWRPVTAKEYFASVPSVASRPRGRCSARRPYWDWQCFWNRPRYNAITVVVEFTAELRSLWEPSKMLGEDLWSVFFTDITIDAACSISSWNIKMQEPI
jgi:hypothetical protein